MVNKWLNIAQNYFQPPVCVLCGNQGLDGLDLCEGCYADLPWLTCVCSCCALPMAVGALCGRCQKKSPTFDRVFAVFEYFEPVDRLICGLKFSAHLHFSTVLGRLMVPRLVDLLANESLPELILPVPLCAPRIRQRGFNQALVLAQVLSQGLNVPLARNACQRIKVALPQVGLGADERRRNLQGAFAVSKKLDIKHVAIVDDVMTTGSTVEELALVLKKQGIERVDVWVCARAGVG